MAEKTKKIRKIKKMLNVYFFVIAKSYLFQEETYKCKPLSLEELADVLLAIQILPIDIKANHSRYYKDSEGNDRAVIFKPEVFYEHTTSIPDYSSKRLINGIFFKRRESNWPKKEDGKGGLQEFEYIDPNNKYVTFAEDSFFIVEPVLGLLIWAVNPRVGKRTSLESYLNNKLDEIRTLVSDLDVDIDTSILDSRLRLALYPIRLPDPKQEVGNLELVDNIEISFFELGDILKAIESNKLKSGTDEEIKEAIKILRLLNRGLVSLAEHYPVMRHMKVTLGKGKPLSRKKLKEIKKEFTQYIPFFKAFIEASRKVKAGTKIIGKDSDGDRRIIDALEDLLYYRRELTMMETEISGGRYIPVEKIYEEITKGFKRKYKQIIEGIQKFRDPDQKDDFTSIFTARSKEWKKLAEELKKGS